MLKPDIDRICAETLRGRFGPSLHFALAPDVLSYPSTRVVDAAATFRNAAVWTSARSGFEQGKL